VAPLLAELAGYLNTCGGSVVLRLDTRVHICLVLLWVAIILPGAALTREMTLEDCISEALELNPAVLDAREALSKARSGVTEARSGFLPNLSLLGSYNFMEKSQTVGFPDPETGQTQEFELDFTRDYSFQLLASQPLYMGGRVSSSYRIADYYREMTESDLERIQIEAATQVVQSFYGLLLAREAVEVSQQALDTAEEFLRVVKARYRTGEASSFEVLRAEVEVSNLKPVLIASRNGVSLSELAIKRAMGISQDAEIEFVGAFRDSTFEMTLDEALGTALEYRPEIRMVDLQKQIASASIGVAKAGRLPTLSLDLNYSLRMDDITFDGDKIEDTYAGYLSLSLPIFDGLRTKSQISQAMSELRQAEIARSDLEEAIGLEVRSALLDIESSLETLRSQRKNVEMAEEGLEIANERYLQGYATNLEVLDAQLALNTARKNRLVALHDLNVAVARALRAMGILLKRFEVEAP
jgi:outer membrane protein TolC